MEEKQIEMKRAHRLTMEGRRCAAITGVSDVLSFDVGEVVLQTEDGLLMIKGEELHVSRLTLEKARWTSMEKSIVSPTPEAREKRRIGTVPASKGCFSR